MKIDREIALHIGLIISRGFLFVFFFLPNVKASLKLFQSSSRMILLLYFVKTIPLKFP
jgi:hypothetical protein